MNKPVDYPLKSKRSNSAADAKSSDFTFAVLRDRAIAKKPVTNDMINVARTKMETAHATTKKSASSQGKLSRFRDRFRAS